MAKALRVGIIGANARGGWAGEAHVPAVQGLDGLELVAVATNRQETADEAAHAFGIERAYGDGAALIADADVDVVTVATRVPDHRPLVLAAITAGKHVYSEWPLGPGRPASEEMARAAAAAGIHHAIGLQLRGSPAVKAARERLMSGAIGRLLSISVFSSTAGFGPEVPASSLYLEDPASFANLVTIQGAHTLDLLLALGGKVAILAALASRQFPAIRAGEEKSPRDRTTFDHLVAQGRFASGAPFTMEVAGGRKKTPFRLDLVGEGGTLTLEGGAPRGLQSSRLGLLFDGERVAVDEGEVAPLPDPAANVGGIYAALRNDIAGGTVLVAGFEHATKLAQMVEDALASSERLRAVADGDWP